MSGLHHIALQLYSFTKSLINFKGSGEMSEMTKVATFIGAFLGVGGGEEGTLNNMINKFYLL